MGTCPLCRVEHKTNREYIWHFFDEGADRGDAIDAVSQACGVRATHIEMLRRIEVDGMKSTLGISTMFADTFAEIVKGLESLTPEAEFRRSLCPACANRAERLRANVGYLLDLLATSPGSGERFAASPGLCFVHFELVWELAPARQDLEPILEVQRKAARSLLHDLQECVRKQDDRYRHEPKGSERDAWLNAIHLTAGWSPPAESAAEPELRR